MSAVIRIEERALQLIKDDNAIEFFDINVQVLSSIELLSTLVHCV